MSDWIDWYYTTRRRLCSSAYLHVYHSSRHGFCFSFLINHLIETQCTSWPFHAFRRRSFSWIGRRRRRVAWTINWSIDTWRRSGLKTWRFRIMLFCCAFYCFFLWGLLRRCNLTLSCFFYTLNVDTNVQLECNRTEDCQRSCTQTYHQQKDIFSTAYLPAPTGLLDATHTAPAVGLLDVQPIFLLNVCKNSVYERLMERKIPHQ